MKDLGHGAGYAYDHDAPDGFSGQDYWPEGLGRQSFYRPTGRGRERAIAERMAEWRRLREERE
jgi:putative ATPase